MSALTDDQLVLPFAISPEAPEATEIVKDVRATEQLVRREWIASGYGEQRALTVALVACAMGRSPRWHLTSYPFGHIGPSIEMVGWVQQDDLVHIATQFVGMIHRERSAQIVAAEVGQAVADAIRMGFLETKRYDAWQPGMASGSGWCDIVKITAYGLAKARPGASRPAPAPKPIPPWRAGPPATPTPVTTTHATEVPPVTVVERAQPAPAAPVAEPEAKIERAQPEPDPDNPAVAFWGGKRIYLGHDTQVSRLFWLLAKPVGFPRQFSEVQKAVDGWDAIACSDEDVRKARLRVRKVASKLREAIREAGLETHVVIHRGGPGRHQDADLSMIWRIPD